MAFLAAVYFQLIHPGTGLPEISVHGRLLLGVAITTVSWVSVTFITRPSDEKTLRSFYHLVKPGGPGWKKVVQAARAEGVLLEDAEKGWDVPAGILCMLLGSLMVYSALFAIGYWIYGKHAVGMLLTVISTGALIGLTRAWKRLRWIENRR